MRNLILIAIVLCSSCSIPRFALGTSENEFLNSCKRCKLIESSTQRTVYRFVEPWLGKQQYYYFQGNKLTRTDKGVSRPDVKIDVYHK